MNNRRRKIIVNICTVIFVLVIALVIYNIFTVTTQSSEETLIQEEVASDQVQSVPEGEVDPNIQTENAEPTGENMAETEPTDYSPDDFKDAVGKFKYSNPESYEEARRIGLSLYGDDPLGHQEEIMKILKDKKLKYENFGFTVLPDHPAQLTPIADTGYQLDVPLLLQADPRWAKEEYGDDPERMRQAGCALVSLAMVESYLEEKETSPMDVFAWSGHDYWIEYEGTSWEIFKDYSKERNWSYKNHKDDFQDAMKAIEEGRVVIASILPGEIAPVGHILVIRGYDPENKLVYINDPNDDPETMWSIQGIDEDILLEEGIQYWSFGH